MQRVLFILGLILLGSYLLLHLALGSSPAQKWVLSEITKTLSQYGVSLKIESIEFSAFSPKLYLNRVTLSTTRKAEIFLENPLSIDKVKIQFNPLALVYKKIVIEEVALFHPQILAPRADLLYQKARLFIAKNKQMELTRTGAYALIIKKVGLVDALFDIQSMNPPFAVRSRSLSVFLEMTAAGQEMISVQSPNIEFSRLGLHLNLSKVDIDVDLTNTGFRANRVMVVGDGLSIDIRGTSSLPMDLEKGPDSFRLSYDVSVPVRLLNEIPEIRFAVLGGQLDSSGTVSMSRGLYSGKGVVHYHDISVDGYKIGNGNIRYQLDRQELMLSGVNLMFGRGDILSQSIRLELKDRIPIAGDLEIRNLPLPGLLESLKTPRSVVKMNIDGTLKVSGVLRGPLDVKGVLKSQFSKFFVLQYADKEPTGRNVIADFGEGQVDGEITFSEERFSFDAAVNAVGGSGRASGYVSYDNKSEVKARLSGLSFDRLGHISTLKVGGQANVVAEVKVEGSDAKVAGMLDVANAQIANIQLGSIKGQAYYQNLLLSFEDLEVPSIEPVRGFGFVDFKPDDVHYKFTVNMARTSVDQVFGILKKYRLGFTIPKGGETTSKATIEGGHDDRGLEVRASGKAKNVNWYSESWNAANFNVVYRDDVFELNRIMLLKESGGLEVKGYVSDKRSRLSFKSLGLQLGEFDFIRGAPLAGRMEGEVTIEGDNQSLLSSGAGQIQLMNTRFRGDLLPDSVITIRPEGKGVEFVGRIMGEGARGRYMRSGPEGMRDEVVLYFQKFDIVPLLSLFLRKDISTITSVFATGNFLVKGNLTDWKTLTGSGLVWETNVGLRGTPMKNTDVVSFKVDRGKFTVSRFNLVGVDGEVAGEYSIDDQAVTARVDGKLDLKYLQPFIPALDYAAGKVSIALRVSGNPAKYKLLGSASLENGAIRFTGLKDEFRATQLQLSASQDQLTIDRFESSVNGGTLSVGGTVRIDRFTRFSPKLNLFANRIQMKFTDFVTAQLSGEFEIVGDSLPYTLKGNCLLHEGRINSFDVQKMIATDTEHAPVFIFDVKGESKGNFMVDTDVMKAEFKGQFDLLGNTNELGLLGRADVTKGSIMFRRTKFDLESGTVRFESPQRIQPRFRMAGSAVVQEQNAIVPQEYQVGLQVFGTADDYKIRLSSTPSLTEGDIISLLVLGVTSQRQTQDAGGSYVKFGTAIVGQMPLQAKIQDELGFDINVGADDARSQQMGLGMQSMATSSGTTTPASPVPSVKIQKRISDRTRVSFTNTLQDIPARELRIEQMLDDNFTVNATAGVESPGNTQNDLRQSYGVDFRFRFQFE